MRDFSIVCFEKTVIHSEQIHATVSEIQRSNSNDISLRHLNIQHYHLNVWRGSFEVTGVLERRRDYLYSQYLIIIRYEVSPELCVACANGCRSLGSQVLCREISGCRGGPLGESGVGGTRRRIRVTCEEERLVSSLDFTDQGGLGRARIVDCAELHFVIKNPK